MKSISHTLALYVVIVSASCASLFAQDNTSTGQSLPAEDSVVSYPPKYFDFGLPNPYADKNRKAEPTDIIATSSDVEALRNPVSPAVRKTGAAQSPSATSWIDKTKDVGQIQYQEDVTPTGARIYTIPFPSPPSAKYSLPLFLQYNSQGGNGLAGYGWELGGISEITLADKTLYYHDTDEAARRFDTDPVFTIDGVPLIENTTGPLSGSYPLISAKGHILVKPNYNGEILTHFDALYPDGSKRTFGFSSTSRFTCTYPVSDAEDKDGNRISYNWTTDSNYEYRLSSISFFNSGNTGSPDGSIDFSYSNRTDYIAKDRAGIRTFRKYLLKEIQIKESASVLSTYSLTHNLEHEVNLLTDIDCTSDGKSLNPLKFTYGDEYYTDPTPDFKREEQMFLSSYFNNSGDTDFIYRRGKFNAGRYNDGLIILPNFSTYAQIASQIKWFKEYHLYGSTYSADQVFLIAPELSYISDVHQITAGSGFQYIDVADVDNDGVDEIIKVNHIGFTSYAVYRISIYGYNGTGIYLKREFDAEIYGILHSGDVFQSPWQRCFMLGDFMGDGTIQLWTSMFNTDPYGVPFDSYMTLIDLNTGSKLAETYLFSLSEEDYAAGKVFCADIDADSKTELCHATSGGLDIYKFNGSSFSLLYTDQTVDADGFANGYHLTDINADGYTDIAVEPATGSNDWKIYTYSGYTYALNSFYLHPKAEGDTYMFFDTDNDGLQDLVQKNGTAMYVYRNDNGRYTAGSRQTSSVSLAQSADFVPCNTVNYGDMSHFITVEGAYINLYAYSRNLTEDRLMTKFTDSYGKTTINSYSDLATSYASVYFIDQERTYDHSKGFARSVFPLQLLQHSRSYLTPECTTDGQLTSLYYAYYDAVTNSEGLGFCGFGKTRTIDFMGSTDKEPVTVTEYLPEMAGAVKKVSRSFRMSQDEPYETTSYTYTTYLRKFGNQDPRPYKTEYENIITGVSDSRNTYYDQYGYPTIDKTSTLSSIPLIDSTYTTYIHKTGTSLYLLGSINTSTNCKITETYDIELIPGIKPASSETTPIDWDDDIKPVDPDDFQPVDPVFRLPVKRSYWCEKQEYTYDTKMRPVQKTEYVGDSLASMHVRLKTKWTYDDCGNVTSEKQAPYNATTFIGKTYTYDAIGKHILSSTDEFGLTTTYSGYNKFGKPETISDHMGRITADTYDAWGNLISRSYPDGSSETTELAWGGKGIYYVLKSDSKKPAERIDYDAAGRAVRAGTARPDAQWSFIDSEYGYNGKVSRQSLPFSGTTASLWNTYEYDEYSRPVSYSGASGENISWSYDKSSTTETRNGLSVTRKSNARGEIVSITDPGGKISYSLRPDGQPSEISVSNGGTTVFKYDVYGNRTEISDPSAGIQKDSLIYNADGSSTARHTNPHGTITTYTDRFGRITKKVITGEYTTEYTYSTSNPTLLLSEVSSNGTIRHFTYDSFDRIASLKETVPDGKWLETTYSYTADGNIASVGYESQDGWIATEEYGYANGHNTLISVDSVPVMQLNSVNEFLNPTSVTTGDITRTYSYSQFGQPSGRTMGEVMDFSYRFDQSRGNLTARTDNVRGGSESFTYDVMDRLTGIGDRAVTYSPNGNIILIEDVGELAYMDSGHPYRVTQLALTGDAVPAAPQSIIFTSYQRPAQITESGRNAAFTYNGAGGRVKMYLAEDAENILTRYYIGDRYELDVTPDGNTERLYVGGNAYGAPMVYVRENDSDWTLYNIGRDYLGSITHIATADGNLVEEYSYDPWGRLRDPETLEIYTPGEEPELFLGRGYTGHEHLTGFGLINMNARLYDPVIGRFISPDPYVQDAESTQGFNRYSYCLNNPLRYSDESGKFIIIDAFFAGLFAGGWKEAIKRAENDAKIIGGLFAVDRNKTIAGRLWEIVSRSIWQPAQTLGGITTAFFYNLFGVQGGVESVDYLYGATVIQTRKDNWGAITQGSFIVGDNDIAADPDNPLFQHEYGHYIQSQKFGWFYYGKFGIPSLISASNSKVHNMNPVEQDANARALKYFNEHNPNYSGWKFTHNPIKNYDPSKSYTDPSNQAAIDTGILHINWFDFLDPLIISAFTNSIVNNQKY